MRTWGNRMTVLRQIGDRLRRAWNSAARKNIQLTDAAALVLKEAERRGHRATQIKQQGAAAILLEDPNGGTIYLWSSEEIVAYGKSKNWV